MERTRRKRAGDKRFFLKYFHSRATVKELSAQLQEHPLKYAADAYQIIEDSRGGILSTDTRIRLEYLRIGAYGEAEALAKKN